MDWTVGDFAFAGVMLGGTGAATLVVLRRRSDLPYRAGAACALLAALLIVWVTRAVGIVGSEENRANLLFLGVVGTAFVGALIARFRSGGLAITMLAAGSMQALIGLLALVFGLGAEGSAWPWDVLGATIAFTGLWLLAALLFATAYRQERGLKKTSAAV